MVDAGADVDAVNSFGHSPLYIVLKDTPDNYSTSELAGFMCVRRFIVRRTTAIITLLDCDADTTLLDDLISLEKDNTICSAYTANKSRRIKRKADMVNMLETIIVKAPTDILRIVTTYCVR